jgi:hypothetical protein
MARKFSTPGQTAVYRESEMIKDAYCFNGASDNSVISLCRIGLPVLK